MQTVTTEDFVRRPQPVLADVSHAESTIVIDGSSEALLLAPLENGLPNPGTLLEIAAQFYDREMISLGRAARIAGLSYSQTIDEFGR